MFADTVSANKILFADSGVPIEKNMLKEEVYYMVVYYEPNKKLFADRYLQISFFADRVSANNLILD